jgi:hypothetical protein
MSATAKKMAKSDEHDRAKVRQPNRQEIVNLRSALAVSSRTTAYSGYKSC